MWPLFIVILLSVVFLTVFNGWHKLWTIVKIILLINFIILGVWYFWTTNFPPGVGLILWILIIFGYEIWQKINQIITSIWYLPSRIDTSENTRTMTALREQIDILQKSVDELIVKVEEK